MHRIEPFYAFCILSERESNISPEKCFYVDGSTLSPETALLKNKRKNAPCRGLKKPVQGAFFAFPDFPIDSICAVRSFRSLFIM
ncbi:hypothetical protein [Caproiciproducens sp.]